MILDVLSPVGKKDKEDVLSPVREKDRERWVVEVFEASKVHVSNAAWCYKSYKKR